MGTSLFLVFCPAGHKVHVVQLLFMQSKFLANETNLPLSWSTRSVRASLLWWLWFLPIAWKVLSHHPLDGSHDGCQPVQLERGPGVVICSGLLEAGRGLAAHLCPGATSVQAVSGLMNGTSPRALSQDPIRQSHHGSLCQLQGGMKSATVELEASHILWWANLPVLVLSTVYIPDVWNW